MRVVQEVVRELDEDMQNLLIGGLQSILMSGYLERLRKIETDRLTVFDVNMTDAQLVELTRAVRVNIVDIDSFIQEAESLVKQRKES